MDEIKVSVIIPVYNGEKTIGKCIESVLNQSLDSVEIIVINDGSTDKTEEILRKYKDVKVINKSNGGQGFARNDGIDAAKGRYIAFVDADDTIERDMLKTMYYAACENNADIVQCAINDIYKGKTTIRPKTAYNVTDVSKIGAGDYIYSYIHSLIYTYEVCNKLFSADFINRNALRFCDTRIYHCEDLIFNFDAVSCAGTAVLLPDAFYNYNISDSGHNKNNKEKKIAGLVKAFERVKEKQSESAAKKAVNCIAAVILLCECVDMPYDFVSGFLKTPKIKEYIRTSAVYKSSFKHFLLMEYLLIMPVKARIKLINSHFRY